MQACDLYKSEKYKRMAVSKGVATVSLQAEQKSIKIPNDVAVAILHAECLHLKVRLIWFLRRNNDNSKVSQICKAVGMAIDVRLEMLKELQTHLM